MSCHAHDGQVDFVGMPGDAVAAMRAVIDLPVFFDVSAFHWFSSAFICQLHHGECALTVFVAVVGHFWRRSGFKS